MIHQVLRGKYSGGIRRAFALITYRISATILRRIRKKGGDFHTKRLKQQSRNQKFSCCEGLPISCSASPFGPRIRSGAGSEHDFNRSEDGVQRSEGHKERHLYRADQIRSALKFRFNHTGSRRAWKKRRYLGSLTSLSPFARSRFHKTSSIASAVTSMCACV